VGQLPVDAYQVLVIHTPGNGPPQPIGRAKFAVQPITGSLALGERLILGSCANGIKLGKTRGGDYSKFRHLQFNNFAISTLFWA
jgi:hypothetical protein